jgi:hypothetical protein
MSIIVLGVVLFLATVAAARLDLKKRERKFRSGEAAYFEYLEEQNKDKE